MPWYTTDHARRDAERQATRQQPKLLDKPQTSKQVRERPPTHHDDNIQNTRPAPGRAEVADEG